MTLTCPRCLSLDVDAETLTCRACHIAYTDNARTFEEHTREHTMVKARWVKWRSVDRGVNARKRVAEFIGG